LARGRKTNSLPVSALCFRHRIWFNRRDPELLMWPFTKKWTPPEPQLVMAISLSNSQLPSIMTVANPAGEGDAVTGIAGPAEGEPTKENMTRPMQEGDYVAISSGKCMCVLSVARVTPPNNPLLLDPIMIEASGLTQATLDQFNQPAWRISLQMQEPGEDIVESVLFATKLAKRLASLGDGIVMDGAAYRFFAAEGWPVENPMEGFDTREHVHIHIEGDTGWFHTHGLAKFGRPELEIYAVPDELTGIAYATLFDIAQYCITTAMIEPGQTCGDPDQPFHARVGSKNRKDHWNDTVVLELVDVDERGKPIPAGAPMALQRAAAG
jgi:hypothetical protein